MNIGRGTEEDSQTDQRVNAHCQHSDEKNVQLIVFIFEGELMPCIKLECSLSDSSNTITAFSQKRAGLIYDSAEDNGM